MSMFSSLSSLLWSSGGEHQQEYTDQETLVQQHGTGEHLETQQEEDWVVVGVADKENTGQPSPHHPHFHHPHHHQHHHHHHHHCHVQPSQSPAAEGHDSLSQNSSGASEGELLEDAATLAQSFTTTDQGASLTIPSSRIPDSPFPLQDCHQTVNHDSDSDTDSLPDSVFSACSGRSHATYHPHGNKSEPWVVAPSPCFIDSNLRVKPAPSNPLENLLIEHPSMSVYLSVPPSSLPPSHPFLSAHLTGDPPTGGAGAVSDAGDVGEQPVLEERVPSVNVAVPGPNAVEEPNVFAHPALAFSQQLTEKAWTDKQVKVRRAQKEISAHKCERQNKVREYQALPRGGNRRNKRTRPSGFKASRCNQRM